MCLGKKQGVTEMPSKMAPLIATVVFQSDVVVEMVMVDKRTRTVVSEQAQTNENHTGEHFKREREL